MRKTKVEDVEKQAQELVRMIFTASDHHMTQVNGTPTNLHNALSAAALTVQNSVKSFVEILRSFSR